MTPGLVMGVIALTAWVIVLARRLRLEHTVMPTKSRLIAVDFTVLCLAVLMLAQATIITGDPLITGVIARTVLAVVGWALVLSWNK